MAEEYKTRYGREFITFHNPIEIDFWKSYQRKNYELSATPSVLYAGRIGIGIQSSLESMARAIDQVNRQFNRSIQFILQTKEKPAWVENYKCVQHKSQVAYSELPRIFAEADFLFLPYDFSNESIRFIKYSMPTKAPEYMVSGTPVIIFGPGETALVKNAIRGNWAKVITEDNIEALSAAINELVTDKGYRNKIAENAITIAETKFSSGVVRNNFREIIASITK
jgi:glycosyltransferase involved in cell wall biosynthesis